MEWNLITITFASSCNSTWDSRATLLIEIEC